MSVVQALKQEKKVNCFLPVGKLVIENVEFLKKGVIKKRISCTREL